MTCEEFDEMLGAFALSALGPEEAENARRHLAACRRHDETLVGFRAIIEQLPLAAEEREPPPQLRSRLLDAFDAESGKGRTLSPTGGSASNPTGRVALFRRPVVAYLAAAALFLAALGLLAWNLDLRFAGNGQQILTAKLAGSGGTGDLVYSRQEHVGVLELNLPAPAAGRAYQAWRIGLSGPASLGLVSGSGPSAFSADLAGATAVAVTEEPAGGSPLPTTDPILVAALP